MIERIKKAYSHKKALIVLFILLFIMLANLLLNSFFKSHFLPNTRVYGVDISFKSPSKAQVELEEKLNQASFNFKGEEDEPLGYITLENLSYNLNTQVWLNDLVTDQKSSSWFASFFSFNNELGRKDLISFNEDQLDGVVEGFGIDNSQRKEAKSAYLVENDDGSFDVVEEVYGNQITGSSLASAMSEAISQGNFELSLKQAYLQPEFKAGDNSLDKHRQQIKNMPNLKITLDILGDQVDVPSELIEEAIFINDEGVPDVHPETFEDFLYEVNEEYAGIYQYHDFNSTNQGIVSVQPGTYGWYIDVEAEAEAIRYDLLAGEDITRDPIVAGSGYDIPDYFGGDYVEVDLTYQSMYVYLDYQLQIQTPIVSGITGAETVPGAYQVWNMESPSVLTGYNQLQELEYQTPVQYWIAFDDNAQGIHDASWQSTFGGEVWRTAGSLGCINTPPSVMGQVYDLVYYGMPVVVFH